MTDARKGVNSAYSGILFFVFLIVTIQVWAEYGQAGLNDRYITVYGVAGAICTLIAFFVWIVSLIRKKNFDENDPSQIQSVGFLAESHKFRLLSRLPFILRIAPFLVIALLMFGFAINNYRVIDVPQAVDGEGGAYSTFEKVYFISVPPGLFEDFLLLALMPSILTIILMFFFRMISGERQSNLGIFLISMIIACMIGSIGYSALLPGFVNTHKNSYGENQEAYIAAFMYAFPTSVMYQVTGVYMPIGHIAHNAAVGINQYAQFSIAQFG